MKFGMLCSDVQRIRTDLLDMVGLSLPIVSSIEGPLQTLLAAGQLAVRGGVQGCPAVVELFGLCPMGSL